MEEYCYPDLLELIDFYNYSKEEAKRKAKAAKQTQTIRNQARMGRR